VLISKNLPTPELKISTTTAVTRDQASGILIGIDRKHPTSTFAYVPHILMKCQMAYLMRWHNPGSQLAGSFQVVSKYLSPLHHPAVNSLNQRPELIHFSHHTCRAKEARCESLLHRFLDNLASCHRNPIRTTGLGTNDYPVIPTTC